MQRGSRSKKLLFFFFFLFNTRRRRQKTPRVYLCPSVQSLSPTLKLVMRLTLSDYTTASLEREG
ncbi:hypothetical protein ACSS6W_003019 [Trichoderma asperelloides]